MKWSSLPISYFSTGDIWRAGVMQIHSWLLKHQVMAIAKGRIPKPLAHWSNPIWENHIFWPYPAISWYAHLVLKMHWWGTYWNRSLAEAYPRSAWRNKKKKNVICTEFELHWEKWYLKYRLFRVSNPALYIFYIQLIWTGILELRIIGHTCSSSYEKQ